MPSDGALVVLGGSFRDPAATVGPMARTTQQDAWNERDPQLPRSRWWLTDAPFVGFRIVSAERGGCGEVRPPTTGTFREIREIRENPCPRDRRPAAAEGMEGMTEKIRGVSRRAFVQTTAAAAAAVAVSGVRISGSDTIRVGLVGCGGRGTGAARLHRADAYAAQVIDERRRST
jgi:hypothetical protein